MTNHIARAGKKGARWDEEGNPLNLEAAAEDAYAWLCYFVTKKRDPKLRAAMKELGEFLDEERNEPSS